MSKPETRYAFKQEGIVHRIYIYDDVTAHGDFNWNTWQYDESETSANYFKEQLEKVQDGDEIELYVNSCGGEVKEGVAIYNMLHRCNAKKTCYVDGFAYSVASLICMACDKIIMGLGTSMLIHEMWTYAIGNAEELRKEADDLDTLMKSNRQIYLKRAKITEDKLIEMMKKETILTPDECLEYGFCDEIAETIPNTPEQDPKQSLEIRFVQMQKQLSDREHLTKQYCEFMKNAELHQEQHKEQHNKCEMLMNAFVKVFK